METGVVTLSPWGCATVSVAAASHLVLEIQDEATEPRVVAHVLADLLAGMCDGRVIATAEGAADLVQGSAGLLASRYMAI